MNNRKKQIKKRRRMMKVTVGAMVVLTFAICIRMFIDKRVTKIVAGSTQEIETSSQTTEMYTNKTDSTTENTTEVTDEITTEATDEITTEAVNEEAEKDAFSDAVFIGDSRTEGLIMQTGIDTTAYVHKGLNVSTAYTDNVINLNGKYVSAMNALENTDYKKVYLMFGINETGWESEEIFISDYRKIIDDIKKDNPDAKIYIQSVIPVSSKVSSTSSYVKNDKISHYNELLKTLALQENVEYVDVASAVSVDGVLPDDAAVDGIHLNQTYCKKWLKYLEDNTL